MTARAFVLEDRSQSHGTEITSRRDQLLQVRLRTLEMPEPSDLAVRVMLFELQGRGLSMSDELAVDLLKTFAAAELIGQGR